MRLGVGLAAQYRIARELGVCGKQCDCPGLRILLRCQREEPLGKRRIRIRPRRDHREVVGVVQGVVDAQAHQSDEEATSLDDQRHRGQDGVGAVAADDQVDFVFVDQPAVQRRDTRGIGLVVVAEKFDRTAQQAALAVDVVSPDLVRELR
jgi:hypothetical protein